MLVDIINLETLGDNRGHLIAIEGGRHVPFEIKRVYYLFDTKLDVARGFHAHKQVKQVAICLAGSCRFVMDNGINKKSIVLNSPSQGLLIDTMQWHEMHDFSSDCILLVLASDVYDESDYIRDYGHFLSLIKVVP